MVDPLLDVLTDAFGAGQRGSETPTLTLRRGYVSAFDAGPPATATITVGGVAAGDIQASYAGLPVTGTVVVGASAYWLQSSAGSGIVLGVGGDEVTVNVESFQTFTQPGTLAVGSGAARLLFPFNVTIESVSIAVNTAPTGASLIVDVNKNGTTIFTTQANRPTITASGYASSEMTPNITSMTALTDYLTIDIDQVGSSVAGSTLTVFVKYIRT